MRTNFRNGGTWLRRVAWQTDRMAFLLTCQARAVAFPPWMSPRLEQERRVSHHPLPARYRCIFSQEGQL